MPILSPILFFACEFCSWEKTTMTKNNFPFPSEFKSLNAAPFVEQRLWAIKTHCVNWRIDKFWEFMLVIAINGDMRWKLPNVRCTKVILNLEIFYEHPFPFWVEMSFIPAGLFLWDDCKRLESCLRKEPFLWHILFVELV